ncbi:MAG: TrpB-like pyridoxal phosphate-dependent enzyme [Candidatus Moranbacteria bacterium]|nr:TrpB-like pyridoxal phosphate-dependent enzyme [Candidatus Moranbacteria bacterium]
MTNNKIILKEQDIAKNFLNINYYLKEKLGKMPEPPLHPATNQPLDPKDLEPLFAKQLIEQELSLEEKIEIPEEIRKMYAMYRPTPLVRALRLEKALETPAKIYFKNEGATLSGSHKVNTAIAQAYYNKSEGVQGLTTETGAGQWGSALSMACNFFGLDCLVYMVRISFKQKPYRKTIMKVFGADILASPSETTKAGKKFLEQDPDTNGSLGMAISEAIEIAASKEKIKYSLGSVLNHVLLHQTVIGEEAKKQLQVAGDYPDKVIGCCGGGSNFAGIAFSFLADKLKGEKSEIEFIGVEPENCPTMCDGEYKYDFGDTARQTPLLKMETLGSDFVPPADHAGGLRYHGIAPILAFLHQNQLIQARKYKQTDVFEAALTFAKTEGIIVAPESSHAVKAAIDEAIKCRENNEAKVILFNLSGHGLLDLRGYEDYLAGKLDNN